MHQRLTEMNKEGLTFVEFVCATGEQIFGPQNGRPLEDRRSKYPRSIVKDWKDGIDPTEYRAP